MRERCHRRHRQGPSQAQCLWWMNSVSILRRLAVEPIGLPCLPPLVRNQAFIVSVMAMDKMEQLILAAPSRKLLQLKASICGVLCQRAEKIKILLIKLVGHR